MAGAQKTHADTFMFRCETCKGKLSARLSSVGRTFACPKCHAKVTVSAPKLQPPVSPTTLPTADPREQLSAFVYAVALFANSDAFNAEGDRDSDLYHRHDDMRVDPDAYPAEMLALLSEFAIGLKQEILVSQHTRLPMPYARWDYLEASKQFSHLYWAMANLDKRFAAPFEMPDATWPNGQRTDDELRKILFQQIDNFEAATVAFSNHFRDSKEFDSVRVFDVLCETDMRVLPRVRRKSLVADSFEPPEAPVVAGVELDEVDFEIIEKRTCNNCQGLLSPHHRFCGDCGQAVGPQCSACNADLVSNDRFCRNCGQPVAA